MKTELLHYTVKNVTEGFVYNEFEGKTGSFTSAEG